jgi:putative acetyltransferase
LIREYRSEDTDALVAIWRAASELAHPFLTDTFMEQEAINLRELYFPNAETWVIEDDGKPAGFVALVGDEIGGLFLDPSLHGRGLGKALVDHVVALKGPLRVEVFEKNTIGRRFYERYGFEEVSNYVHEPSGEMTLRLALSQDS